MPHCYACDLPAGNKSLALQRHWTCKSQWNQSLSGFCVYQKYEKIWLISWILDNEIQRFGSGSEGSETVWTSNQIWRFGANFCWTWTSNLGSGSGPNRVHKVRAPNRGNTDIHVYSPFMAQMCTLKSGYLHLNVVLQWMYILIFTSEWRWMWMVNIF